VPSFEIFEGSASLPFAVINSEMLAVNLEIYYPVIVAAAASFMISGPYD
jgi:hypothetical protein